MKTIEIKPYPVFSHFQAKALYDAKQAGRSVVVTSMDLGVHAIEAQIHQEQVSFPDGTLLTWDDIVRIMSDTEACFYLCDSSLHPIRLYSEQSGRSYSLMPCADAPALIIAGFPMHRIKNITPLKAAAAMVDAIQPLRGAVLDTATGLGYTAIAAAATATGVVTVELDPASLQIAQLNPWSAGLFTDPKITRIAGDSAREIEHFSEGRFSAVIHDPPTVSLAGDLYSGLFYRELFRVLKPGGRLFHYIADPESSTGKRLYKGVIRRLYDAGFSNVTQKPHAFGVVAFKG